LRIEGSIYQAPFGIAVANDSPIRAIKNLRLMVYSVVLITSTHVSDDAVYKVTKAIDDSKATFEAAASYLKKFDPKTMAEASIVPYPPGAETFFREIDERPSKKR
jgi:TRAP-type uncharacterized transport system substrate-binding protein